MRKEPWEWDEQDLSALVSDGIKESFELEYKASAALANRDAVKDEISKDVSAFANAGGGTLIYGMREENHLPVGVDEGTDPDGPTNREWLENVITSRIHPRIEGLRVREIVLRDDDSRRVAFIVHVPQSLRAPHQAHDRRYYKRHNFKVEPMEDYEVRDVLRRAETPEVDAYPLLRNRFPDLNAEIAVLLENKADAPAEFVHAKVGVDLRLSPKPAVQFRASNIANLIGTPHAVILHEFQGLWGRDRSCPVFNGVLADLGTISITIPPAGGRFLLAWTVQSPRMPPRRGHHLLVYEKTETGARYGFEPVEPSTLDSLLQDIRDNENFLREPPQA